MSKSFRHNNTRRDAAEHDVHGRPRAYCNEPQACALHWYLYLSISVYLFCERAGPSQAVPAIVSREGHGRRTN